MILIVSLQSFNFSSQLLIYFIIAITLFYEKFAVG